MNIDCDKNVKKLPKIFLDKAVDDAVQILRVEANCV